VIKNLSIDPTYDCNKRCPTCRCPEIAKQYPFSQQLNETKIEKLLFAFKNIGGESVFIFGGEPLLVPITFYILERAKYLKFYTAISTNAICLSDEDVANRLISCKPDIITISLMGIDEESHQISKVLSGIQNIYKYKKSSLDLSAHVTVHSGNVHELTDILYFAIEQGIPRISYQYVSRTDKTDNENMKRIFPNCFITERSHWTLSDDILLKKQQISIIKSEIANIEEISKRGGIKVIIDPVFTTEFDETTLLTGKFTPRGKCMLSDIIVAPNGDLSLCPMLQHLVLANINDIELADYIILLNSYMRRLNDGNFFPVCYGCCKHTMFYNN
jgi:MoaA/NifB/PqqE/SkfB family radical SAM enzyme